MNRPECPLNITFEGTRKMTSAITAFVVEFHCYTFVSFSRVRSCLLEEEIFDIILLLDEDMQKQV
jgi:hypothetical protein